MGRGQGASNRIVVGGVDLYERFGLVMTDDYTLGPPAPKSYEVDVPGGDGSIDVTEAVFGDAAYGDREMSFRFLVERGRTRFWQALTDAMSYLHGRRYDFELSFDPGYTYNGRFKVDEAYSRMHHGVVAVSVRARPYKFARHVRERVAAAGGVTVDLVCGRRRQCPTITCNRVTQIKVGDELTARLPVGVWTVPELWLGPGHNSVYVNSAPYECDALVSDHAAKRASELAGSRVYETFRKSVPQDLDGYEVWFEYDIEEL